MNHPAIDIQDPVLLHLLTETAIGDSAGYQILPFEEVEGLKQEYARLSSRIENTKRKLALESKLRDAAQSLRRLSKIKSIGSANGATNGEVDGQAHHLEDEEFQISSRKCEELSQELWGLEKRAQEVHKRLLEHTAGILQLTHRGLKKNNNRGSSNNDHVSATFEFDERSLYRELEVDDAGTQSSLARNGLEADVDTLRATEQKLEQLNGQLRDLLLASRGVNDVPPMPLRVTQDTSLTYIQDHLAYLEKSLEMLQAEGHQVDSGDAFDMEISASEMGSELRAINMHLQSLLGQAGSHLSPTLPPPPSPSGQYLTSHMDYLKAGMADLQNRVAGLQDQKSILTTQIQQQRELNSKSDAEKDAHVADLAQQLMETKKQYELSERELEALRDELALVMEQLDSVKQQGNIEDQQREREQAGALEREKQARSQAELELQNLQEEFGRVTDEQARNGAAALDEEREARLQAESEAQRLKDELAELEGEFARAQTELTVVKAELDGAYGTRAQRAAEAAANPALYKEIEDLNTKNISLAEELAALRAEQMNNQNSSKAAAGQTDELQKRVETLQKELEETIEDYEAMTKASIEFEKERERYEGTIDTLRDRIEQLEAQLSDERITWMGVSQTAMRDGATETTSTMVLKNEFKKMMRDTRTENLKLLRVCSPRPLGWSTVVEICVHLTDRVISHCRPNKKREKDLKRWCALLKWSKPSPRETITKTAVYPRYADYFYMICHFFVHII